MRPLLFALLVVGCGGSATGDPADAAASCLGASAPGVSRTTLVGPVCVYSCEGNTATVQEYSYCPGADGGVGRCENLTNTITNCGTCGHVCPILGGVQTVCRMGGLCQLP